MPHLVGLVEELLRRRRRLPLAAGRAYRHDDRGRRTHVPRVLELGAFWAAAYPGVHQRRLDGCACTRQGWPPDHYSGVQAAKRPNQDRSLGIDEICPDPEDFPIHLLRLLGDSLRPADRE